MPVRGGLGGPLSLSAPSGKDGCFKGRRSKPLTRRGGLVQNGAAPKNTGSFSFLNTFVPARFILQKHSSMHAL